MAHVYTFKNAGYDGTLVLDLSGADHTTVLGWTPNGGPNQKWTLERDILLFAFFFKNLDNRYLGIDSTLQRPVGVEDQAQAVKFHIEPAQQGKVRIRELISNLVFDLGPDNIVSLKAIDGSQQTQYWTVLPA